MARLPPLPPNVQTPADEARVYLDRAERNLGQVKESGPAALEILHDLDRAAACLAELANRGTPILAETGRLEGLQRAVQERAGWILAEVGRPAFHRARTEALASGRPLGPWWDLETITAKRRRETLLRLAIAGLCMLACAGIIWFFSSPFAPGDPAARQAYGHITAGQTALEDKDLDRAAAEFTAATQIQPNDPTGWLLLGAVRLRQGQTVDAETAFGTAQSLYPDRATYYVERSTVLSTAGLADQAAADAEQAVQLAPNNPRAFFALGSALEAQGKDPEALDAFQKTADLAQASNESALVALARLRVGYLLQRLHPAGP